MAKALKKETRVEPWASVWRRLREHGMQDDEIARALEPLLDVYEDVTLDRLDELTDAALESRQRP